MVPAVTYRNKRQYAGLLIHPVDLVASCTCVFRLGESAAAYHAHSQVRHSDRCDSTPLFNARGLGLVVLGLRIVQQTVQDYIVQYHLSCVYNFRHLH